ncbi:AcrR family transcriptional regulator [Sphingomonas zeicaulis]|uniref:TetR/AcrR family transcriptional regulator n=1 Tax=Sphingomonas zeicaulis TaxID=1632740 RepID=UPI003D1A3C29
MARPKAFDSDTALDAAIGVFREHGFEGTSAQMLVDAMGIGRQSLYDTFGDKWLLYQRALRRYSQGEISAHRAAMTSGTRAIDGLHAMIDRVVADAALPCLGVGSIAEFGCSRPELAEITGAADRGLRAAVIAQVEAAQEQGDIPADIDPDIVATYMVASFAGIRIAARAGTEPEQMRALGEMTKRALR